MNLDTIEKRMPEWYSSHEDIAYHTHPKRYFPSIIHTE